jgi:hypothetical protein
MSKWVVELGPLDSDLKRCIKSVKIDGVELRIFGT